MSIFSIHTHKEMEKAEKWYDKQRRYVIHVYREKKCERKFALKWLKATRDTYRNEIAKLARADIL